jgi:hypothetical protein
MSCHINPVTDLTDSINLSEATTVLQWRPEIDDKPTAI